MKSAKEICNGLGVHMDHQGGAFKVKWRALALQCGKIMP